MSEVLGVLFAVILGLSFLPKLTTYIQDGNDNVRMAATAQQQTKLIGASSDYIKQYNSNIQSVATATTPAVITVPMLQAVKLLDASFSPTNPYGQTWQTQVLQPTAGNLEAYVMSYGGTAMQDKIGSKIAGLVGGVGGFIPVNDSGIYTSGAGTAYGTFGGWAWPTANYTSISGGHLAARLTFNAGQLTSNYLYRNAVPGQPQLNRMGTSLDMGGNNVNNAGTVTAGGRITAGEYVLFQGVATENTPCPTNGLVGRDANGLLLSCQSGVWKRAVKSPNMYRYVFTTSQSWTVPVGVTSAFVTMAGGGASGYGWRYSNTYSTGSSGGFLFSAPVNLVAGETMTISVGKGGKGYGPVNTGVLAPLGYVWGPPGGDDGLGGYPGGATLLISPSAGVLLECDGGSGATSQGVDTYSGTLVVGGVPGATAGSGAPAFPAPNRTASGPYAHAAGGPGACGAAAYGVGNGGTVGFNMESGTRDGGLSPFGYGSGGGVGVYGCYVTTTAMGTCTWANDGRDGVVMLDVLY